jgi:tRNA dimethylallyltransferase
LAGEYNEATFINKANAATRQLAKRQLTWLRSMNDVYVIDCLDIERINHIISQVGQVIK